MFVCITMAQLGCEQACEKITVIAGILVIQITFIFGVKMS